jgi:serine/threonine protein kinase
MSTTPRDSRHRADLDQVLADYLRRLDAGEPVDEAALIARYPELAAELRTYFSQAGAVERLGEAFRKHQAADVTHDKALPPANDIDGTIAHHPTRKDSRGLQICCPHCSNFVEVLTDTPYEEISCSTCGSTFSLVDREEMTRMAAPLKSIGRFDLISRLGLGGFGTVWKARDRDLDRTVAVKIPRRGQLAPSEIDQFFREARAAAQLRHPNIVQVHEVGRDGDTLFIVSDLVRGVTLSDWLTGKRLAIKEAAQLCIPIVAALHHAHQQGVVHRDLKPSNIMIDEEGQPHLTDFGLAKREIGEITMTVDGQILGTPSYMSPEQAAGEGHWTDRRTDIYSFGVVLFELLVGELPFRGNAQMQVHQRLTEDAPDPRKLNNHIPRDLATICWKCLEREPGNRYATAAEVGDELQRFLRGEPIHARPLSPIGRFSRWAQRKPMVATTAALTIILAIFGPASAMLIARQKKDLTVRYNERADLILRAHNDISQAKGKIADLETQLSAWEGKAAPSDFWPPHREKPPRRLLLADLFRHASGGLASQLRAGSFDAESTARGYLGLALMASEADDPAHAKEYYGLARDELVKLRQQQPNEPRIARALAACQTQLAHLTVDDDRTQAAQDFGSARAAYERLATNNKRDLETQIEWLEAELNSEFVPADPAGTENLMRADQIQETLSSQWPKDPNALYRLVCYLTHQAPILAESPGTVVPNVESTPANPPRR